jgi:tRNA G10  N-methylase Trm11
MRQLDSANGPATRRQPSAQTILNGEVHNWYRLRLGYSDHLVADLLDKFGLRAGDSVLDPFCGSGTSLVECMKKGIDSVGIDANPSSCFAATVKTNWQLQPTTLLSLLDDIERAFNRCLRSSTLCSDPTFLYLKETGMLERGWISPSPLVQSLAIKRAICDLHTSSSYKNALFLALIAEVVDGASNVKFGPELYCGPSRDDHDVLAGFVDRLELMASDLKTVRNIPNYGAAEVLFGDSRKCRAVFARRRNVFSAVICSPPYPAEHDYTRNARLELAFLEAVRDRDTLREIKKGMIRSHTKGIYKSDRDDKYVVSNKTIKALVTELEEAIIGKKYGFARLYPKVVQEYFGGMKRHLMSVLKLLSPGGLCAYVVGDQGSYLGVHVPTAKILAQLAEEAGFEVTDIKKWRTRWASTSARGIDENIVLFKKAITRD